MWRLQLPRQSSTIFDEHKRYKLNDVQKNNQEVRKKFINRLDIM